MTSEQAQTPIVTGEPNATQKPSGWWADDYGIVGPYKPGVGPRSDPRGAFSTGPAIGEVFPAIVAPDQTGTVVDVNASSAGTPSVVVFSRATVW